MRNRFLIVAFVLIPLLPSFASGQANPGTRPNSQAKTAAGPSLAETTRWIKEALSSHGVSHVTIHSHATGANAWNA